MAASHRNQILADLAKMVIPNPALNKALKTIVCQEDVNWTEALAAISAAQRDTSFAETLDNPRNGVMDVAYDGERLSERPDLLLNTILELASARDSQSVASEQQLPVKSETAILEQRLMDAVDPERRGEAEEILHTARLNWRLRDDDNVLIGRLESQLLRALELAADRLRASGRLEKKVRITLEAGEALVHALRDSSGTTLTLSEPATASIAVHAAEQGTPRQLVGQPAAPGVATGLVRRVRGPEDLGRFRSGEVLVCDAIQPTMTHLVPLAGAIVERRGGMLIHGAIIARELGIPCANGVASVVDLVENGEIITVDGYLGIVTAGPPEFELEGTTQR